VSLDLVRVLFSMKTEEMSVYLFLLTSLVAFAISLFLFFLCVKSCVFEMINVLTSTGEKNEIIVHLNYTWNGRCPPTHFLTRSCILSGKGSQTEFQHNMSSLVINILYKIIQRINDNEWICNECLCLFFLSGKFL